jgi:hypothetical protein
MCAGRPEVEVQTAGLENRRPLRKCYLSKGLVMILCRENGS